MKKRGKYNVTSSLLKYDCHKARKQGVNSIDEDMSRRGYDVKRIEMLNREALRLPPIALIEVRIQTINHPDYITELMPLWEFDNK